MPPVRTIFGSRTAEGCKPLSVFPRLSTLPRRGTNRPLRRPAKVRLSPDEARALAAFDEIVDSLDAD